MSALARLEAATAARTSASARWERMIRLARQEGHSLREVAKAAGVTHAAIAKKLGAAGYPLAQKTKATRRGRNLNDNEAANEAEAAVR